MSHVRERGIAATRPRGKKRHVRLFTDLLHQLLVLRRGRVQAVEVMCESELGQGFPGRLISGHVEGAAHAHTHGRAVVSDGRGGYHRHARDALESHLFFLRGKRSGRELVFQGGTGAGEEEGEREGRGPGDKDADMKEGKDVEKKNIGRKEREDKDKKKQ